MTKSISKLRADLDQIPVLHSQTIKLSLIETGEEPYAIEIIQTDDPKNQRFRLENVTTDSSFNEINAAINEALLKHRFNLELLNDEIQITEIVRLTQKGFPPNLSLLKTFDERALQNFWQKLSQKNSDQDETTRVFIKKYSDNKTISIYDLTRDYLAAIILVKDLNESDAKELLQDVSSDSVSSYEIYYNELALLTLQNTKLNFEFQLRFEGAVESDFADESPYQILQDLMLKDPLQNGLTAIQPGVLKDSIFLSELCALAKTGESIEWLSAQAKLIEDPASYAQYLNNFSELSKESWRDFIVKNFTIEEIKQAVEPQKVFIAYLKHLHDTYQNQSACVPDLWVVEHKDSPRYKLFSEGEIQTFHTREDCETELALNADHWVMQANNASTEYCWQDTKTQDILSTQNPTEFIQTLENEEAEIKTTSVKKAEKKVDASDTINNISSSWLSKVKNAAAWALGLTKQSASKSFSRFYQAAKSGGFASTVGKLAAFASVASHFQNVAAATLNAQTNTISLFDGSSALSLDFSQVNPTNLTNVAYTLQPAAGYQITGFDNLPAGMNMTVDSQIEELGWTGYTRTMHSIMTQLLVAPNYFVVPVPEQNFQVVSLDWSPIYAALPAKGGAIATLFQNGNAAAIPQTNGEIALYDMTNPVSPVQKNPLSLTDTVLGTMTLSENAIVVATNTASGSAYWIYNNFTDLTSPPTPFAITSPLPASTNMVMGANPDMMYILTTDASGQNALLVAANVNPASAGFLPGSEQTLPLGTDNIVACPDGLHFIAAGSDGTFYILSQADGSIVGQYTLPGKIQSLAYIGELLLVGTDDKYQMYQFNNLPNAYDYLTIALEAKYIDAIDTVYAEADTIIVPLNLAEVLVAKGNYLQQVNIAELVLRGCPVPTATGVVPPITFTGADANGNAVSDSIGTKTPVAYAAPTLNSNFTMPTCQAGKTCTIDTSQMFTSSDGRVPVITVDTSALPAGSTANFSDGILTVSIPNNVSASNGETGATYPLAVTATNGNEVTTQSISIPVTPPVFAVPILNTNFDFRGCMAGGICDVDLTTLATCSDGRVPVYQVNIIGESQGVSGVIENNKILHITSPQMSTVGDFIFNMIVTNGDKQVTSIVYNIPLAILASPSPSPSPIIPTPTPTPPAQSPSPITPTPTPTPPAQSPSPSPVIPAPTPTPPAHTPSPSPVITPTPTPSFGSVVNPSNTTNNGTLPMVLITAASGGGASLVLISLGLLVLLLRKRKSSSVDVQKNEEANDSQDDKSVVVYLESCQVSDDASSQHSDPSQVSNAGSTGSNERQESLVSSDRLSVGSESTGSITPELSPSLQPQASTHLDRDTKPSQAKPRWVADIDLQIENVGLIAAKPLISTFQPAKTDIDPRQILGFNNYCKSHPLSSDTEAGRVKAAARLHGSIRYGSLLAVRQKEAARKEAEFSSGNLPGMIDSNKVIPAPQPAVLASEPDEEPLDNQPPQKKL